MTSSSMTNVIGWPAADAVENPFFGNLNRHDLTSMLRGSAATAKGNSAQADVDMLFKAHLFMVNTGSHAHESEGHDLSECRFYVQWFATEDEGDRTLRHTKRTPYTMLVDDVAERR